MSILLENYPIQLRVSSYRKAPSGSTHSKHLGPVVQSVVCLTSSLRVISLSVLADSIHNILIFFAEKIVSSFLHCKSYSHFFSKKFQHVCVSFYVNFNELLTNDIVSFEQLGPVFCCCFFFCELATFTHSCRN